MVWLPTFCVFIHLLMDRHLDCFRFCPPGIELLWNVPECLSVCGRVSPFVPVSAWAWISRVVCACAEAVSSFISTSEARCESCSCSAALPTRGAVSLSAEAGPVGGLWRLAAVSLLTNDESFFFLKCAYWPVESIFCGDAFSNLWRVFLKNKSFILRKLYTNM